ncbi:MAG: hypothetical protein ACK5MV_13580 [Aminipila sp.]
MNFENIENLVASDKELPKDSTLTDQYAYETLKSLNFQYKSKLITREKASKSKKLLIRRYEEQKKLDKNRRDNWEKELKNIQLSGETRVKLNKACKDGIVTVGIFLEAIKCISLMCGDTMHYESCKKQLEVFDNDEIIN